MNFNKAKLIWELLEKAIRLLLACRIFIERQDSHTPGRAKMIAMIDAFDEELLNANVNESEK